MGDLTIVDEGNFVVASSTATEAELRASIAPEAPAAADREKSDASAGTDEVAAAPPPAPTSESEPPPAESTEDAVAERDDQGRFKAKETKPPVERRKASIQSDIDKLTYQRREEERRLDSLRAERQKLETPAKPEPAKSSAQTFKEFLTPYAAANPNATYEDAIDAYQVERDERLLKQIEDKQQQRATNAEYETRLNAHLGRMQKLAATTPDWDTAVANMNLVLAGHGFVDHLPAVLNEAILRSDKSEQIVRHLSLHPEIALQMALDAKDAPMSPATVKLMRTVLESQLGTMAAPASGPAAVPRQSQAHPPPKPVGSSPTTSDASDEPSYEQILDRVTKNLHPKR